VSECALGRLGGRTKVGRGRPCRPICVACGWGDSMKRHIGLGSRSLGCIPVHKVRCSRWAHPRHLGVLRLSRLSDKTDRQSYFSACMAGQSPKGRVREEGSLWIVRGKGVGAGESGQWKMVSREWKARLLILCMTAGILLCDADGRGTRGRGRRGGDDDGGLAVVGGRSRSDRLLIEKIISSKSPRLSHLCILHRHHEIVVQNLVLA
jgi:hypothetical protein